MSYQKFFPDIFQPRDRGIITEKSQLSQLETISDFRESVKSIYSIAFNNLLQGKLTYDQVKVFITSNIVKKFVNSHQQNFSSSSQQIQLNDELQECFEYLTYKYPCNKQNQNSKMLQQFDNSDSLTNNYLFNTSIAFQYRQTGDYSDIIMRLINQIIQRIHSTEIKQRIKQKLDGFSQLGNYSIRIPNILQRYGQKDIKNLNFKITQPLIYQLLRNWIEQLLEKFRKKKYFEKKSQNTFLPKSKKINNLQHWMKTQLDEEMQKQKLLIQQFSTNQKNQLFQTINKNLSGVEFKQFNLNNQKVIAQFAIKTTNSLYQATINYLNRLIHGLLSVSYRFFNRQQLSKSAWPQPPNIISFKPYNLIKIIVSGQQKLKILQQLSEEFSKQDNTFSLVSKKNNIASPQKSQQIVVKVKDFVFFQVSYQQILYPNKNDKLDLLRQSQFQRCSKFIYKLIIEGLGNIYGAILQTSRIWSENDGLISYYRKKIRNYSVYQNLNIDQLKKKFPQTIQPLLGDIIISRQKFPQYGVCAFASSKQYVPFQYQAFTYYEDADDFYLVGADLNGQINLLVDLSNIQNFDNFIKTHYILALKGQIPEQLKIKQAEIKKKFILPKYVKRCLQNGKETISLINNNLTDQQCEKIFSIGNQQSKKRIKNIFLTDNQITRIDYIASQYPNVTWLQLNRTNLTNYKGLNNLSKIKILILDRCQMTTLAPQICQLQNLQVMTISESNIRSLPKEVSNLKSLSHLQLDFNKLIQLPEEFCSCTSLKTLNLDGNCLKSLPENFGKLSNIQRLFLGANKFYQIPPQIFEIKGLIQLHLKNNSIIEINGPYQKLNALILLDLSRNQISVLPQDLKKASSLKSLNLQNNKLESLPNWVKQYESLKIQYQENPKKQ